MLALEHLKRRKQHLLVLEYFKCCKLQHSLAWHVSNALNYTICRPWNASNAANCSISWSWNVSNAANFQYVKRTTGPPDQRTTGPEDHGTRATPGPSHTFAKKNLDPGPRASSLHHGGFFEGLPPVMMLCLTGHTL